MIVDQNSLTLKPGQVSASLVLSGKNNPATTEKSEIERYRAALAKMEEQWEHATRLLNENTMHQQIE